MPSTPHAPQASQVPQKLNGTKDVHFFSVGNLHGRTLVIYMKKKGLDSIFRVLEPVGDKINERSRQPAGFGSKLGFRSAKSEWFRIYRVGYLLFFISGKLMFSLGLFPALGIVRFDLLESKNCDFVYEGIRDYGPF